MTILHSEGHHYHFHHYHTFLCLLSSLKDEMQALRVLIIFEIVGSYFSVCTR